MSIRLKNQKLKQYKRELEVFQKMIEEELKALELDKDDFEVGGAIAKASSEITKYAIELKLLESLDN